MSAFGNPLDLSSRTILVTGASSGIGRATCLLMSHLGARVLLCGRNQQRLDLTRSRMVGDGHVVAPFDLDNVPAICGWMRGQAEAIGPFDGLVHCAGIHLAMPLRLTSAHEAERVMRTNWLVAMELTKALRVKKVHATPARVVFVSSAAAIAGQSALSAYSSSKGALLSLARALAVELAGEGITVNCVTPGVVRSEMVDEFAGRLTSEQFVRLQKLHPLGLGTAEDVAAAIVYLVAETGRWITGTSLVVDGGLTA
jgi:NAD(P)-dependent dehydrogenase (short-subunit alcohol dehydrogenase family)